MRPSRPRLIRPSSETGSTGEGRLSRPDREPAATPRPPGTGTLPRAGCCTARPSEVPPRRSGRRRPLRGSAAYRPTRAPAGSSPCRSSGRPRARPPPWSDSGARRCGAEGSFRVGARRPAAERVEFARLLTRTLFSTGQLVDVHHRLPDLLVRELLLERGHRVPAAANLVLDRGGGAVRAPYAVDQVRVGKPPGDYCLAVADPRVASGALVEIDA